MDWLFPVAIWILGVGFGLVVGSLKTVHALRANLLPFSEELGHALAEYKQALTAEREAWKQAVAHYQEVFTDVQALAEQVEVPAAERLKYVSARLKGEMKR